MKPNKNRNYKCPHGKSEPKVPAKVNYNKGSESTVSGTFCKNNCELYMRGCKKWMYGY